MSVDFKRLLSDLRSLIFTLKERCSDAEAVNEQLRSALMEREARIKELETLNKSIETKYLNLKAALATGNTPEDREQQKERFMVLVREIDDCIAKLNR